MSSAKKITLTSSDGDAFEVNEAVLLQSQVLKHMIEDDCVDSGIPLPNVTSKILAKVIEYCKKHAEAVNSEDKPSKNEPKAWDADFVKFDRDTIFDLMLVIKHVIEDDCVDSGIPLPNVTSKIRAKVIEFCEKKLKAYDTDSVQWYLNTLFPEDEPSKKELKAWDADFVKVDLHTILGLILVIKHMIEDDCIDSGIRLPNVTSKIRAKVIEYCKNELKASEADFVQWHLNTLFPEDEPSKKELKAWDADFVKVDRKTIFELLLAANDLKIESLLDLLSETIADMTKGMNAKGISMFFGHDQGEDSRGNSHVL